MISQEKEQGNEKLREKKANIKKFTDFNPNIAMYIQCKESEYILKDRYLVV